MSTHKCTSFFHLTAPRSHDDGSNPLYDLTEHEFDTFFAEATPLNEALHDAINAYSEAHGGISLMACYMASDMLRDYLKQEWAEASADA
jgi:hypothetical protein